MRNPSKKVTLKHMQENGTVATRTTARTYTYVALAAYVDIEVEVARELASLAQVESYATWSDAEKADRRAYTEKRIAALRATGSDYTVISWHADYGNAARTVAGSHGKIKNLTFKFEEVNNGVRAHNGGRA